jgi:hypothetical protein
MATFTLLDLVHKLKEIVQELVNEDYSQLETYGLLTSEEIKDEIQDYPGAVAIPPDEEFIDAVSHGSCWLRGEPSSQPAEDVSFDDFASFVLEKDSEWMIDTLLWEPGDPPVPTQLVLTVEFSISEDTILPKIRELRVS